MKTNKVLAVALSAGLVLGGASVANAAPDGKYETKQDAVEAAKKELENNGGQNNSYEISGVDGAWFYRLKIDTEDDDLALNIAREAAKKEIDKLDHLDNKIAFKTQIDVDDSVEKINSIVEEARVRDASNLVEKTKEDLGKENLAKKEALANAKDEAKKEIDKLKHLDNKPGFKTQIDVAKSVVEINQIVEEARVRDASNLVEKTKDELGKENLAKKELEDAAKKEADADKLNQAKIDAIYDLIAAGITNDFYHKQIEKGKTIEGVEALKNEILKAHEASKPEDDKKPEDKKTQTLDEWQIEQNEKDGYFTEEDARRAGDLALEKARLEGLYKVEVRKNAVGDMWFWRFVPVEAAEEEKPGESIPWTPLTPANPINPGTPWTPIVPGETDKPGQDEDDKVVVPEEDEKDKDSKDKEKESEESKEKEDSKDKEKEDSKDKEKSKEKSKPAKTKGNNPKTGLAGLAPIYSTLAISMAGIVAARKKND